MSHPTYADYRAGVEAVEWALDRRLTVTERKAIYHVLAGFAPPTSSVRFAMERLDAEMGDFLSEPRTSP